MSLEPFVFVKDFQQRLEDLMYILGNDLEATKIKEEWCNFLELSIEPVGWKAIWKISRELCVDMSITYPCTVIVMVEEVNFKDLTCLVTVNEVEDENICFPDQMADIPLIELYPTLQQDSSCDLSLLETAKSIDNFRFFYNRLWMPWDLDYDEDSSWVNSHLNGRLHLHFAIMDRTVPHDVAYTVHKLVAEGRKIQKEIEETQEQMLEDMEVNEYPGKLLQLTELHNRMSSLRNQYTIYENPDLLKALIGKIYSKEKKTALKKENFHDSVLVVLSSSTPEQLLRLANLTTNKKLIRYFPTLQEALFKANGISPVWVFQGTHPIHDLGALEVGGTIRGIEPEAIITEDAEGSSGLNILQYSLYLQHLTVKMTTVWNIIKVRPETQCVLHSVKLEGSSVTDGIDVFPGAKLFAENCEFSNCRTAIACDSGSSVTLKNCTFKNNNVAIELKEGCKVNVEHCTIADSKLYGISIFMKSPPHPSDSVESINRSGVVSQLKTTFENNAKDFHFTSTSLEHTVNQNSVDNSESK